MIELSRPSLKLVSEYQKFAAEMLAAGEKIFHGYLPVEGEGDAAFVERMHVRSVSPEAGLVPETIYWAVFEDQVVGRISLRQRLEGNLTKIGGHIGYEVRPSYRRRGFATGMLRLILQTEEARAIGRLLLTCAPENSASIKTIKANGGVLSATVFVDLVKADRHHFYITLD